MNCLLAKRKEMRLSDEQLRKSPNGKQVNRDLISPISYLRRLRRCRDEYRSIPDEEYVFRYAREDDEEDGEVDERNGGGSGRRCMT